MKIGIIGCGIVGSALKHIFEEYSDVVVNDPNIKNSVSYKEMYDQCELIFVCVPTPMKRVEGGEIDTKILDFVINALTWIEIEKSGLNLQSQRPVICIKSTVTPNKLKQYDKGLLRLTMSPEYLTEANYLEDAIKMKSLVVGGKPEDRKVVIDAFDDYSICTKPYPIGEVDLIAAGVLKYMENCFLAMKVTFMNQFYDILKESGSTEEWKHLAEVFQLDTRMGNSHHMVPGPDGDFGWGGKCFSKDVNALIHYAKNIGVDVDIMEKCWEINMRIRKDIDWARIEGAVSKKGDKE